MSTCVYTLIRLIASSTLDPSLCLSCCALHACSRREAVRAAMLHSWRGYEKYAWGNDELCPVTLKGKNGFGGLGATMIDALDTLHMMGELQLLCCGWRPRRYCLQQSSTEAASMLSMRRMHSCALLARLHSNRPRACCAVFSCAVLCCAVPCPAQASWMSTPRLLPGCERRCPWTPPLMPLCLKPSFESSGACWPPMT